MSVNYKQEATLRVYSNQIQQTTVWSHQPGSVNENAASEKRHVVSGVKAVPESTEEKHRHSAV